MIRRDAEHLNLYREVQITSGTKVPRSLDTQIHDHDTRDTIGCECTAPVCVYLICKRRAHGKSIMNVSHCGRCDKIINLAEMPAKWPKLSADCAYLETGER